MSYEAIAPGSGEIQTPPLNFETDLREARQHFYDLPLEDDFQVYSTAQGVKPDDMESPHYWRAVAQYASTRATVYPERISPVDTLLAATPDFIFAQAALSRGRHSFASKDAYNDARNRASHYNNLVRDVADSYPDARPSELIKAIVNTANISIENPHLRKASVNMARETIRGAQHEVGFGQILAATDREHRPSTTEEDLHGVDWVVIGRKHRPIRIDVKASLSAVEGKGQFDQPYSIDNRDGLITMYSLIHDREFHDSFHIAPEAAQQKAEHLEKILEVVEYDHFVVAGAIGHSAMQRQVR